MIEYTTLNLNLHLKKVYTQKIKLKKLC